MLPAPLAILFSEGPSGLVAMILLALALWIATKVLQVALLLGLILLAAYLLNTVHPLVV